MFLQNYVNFRWNMFFGPTSPSSPVQNMKGQPLVGIDGSVKTCGGHADIQKGDIGFALACGPVIGAITSAGVYFGTGPTPAKLDDYTLQSPITTGLEIVHKAVSIAEEIKGRWSVCGQYTLKNTSGEPINIYEIGCVARVYSGSSTSNPILMERTVLTEPITIGWGETKLITYKLTFNQTLNVEQ